MSHAIVNAIILDNARLIGSAGKSGGFGNVLALKLPAEEKPKWAYNVITDGFAKLEKMLQSHSGTFCVGDNVTFADICLVPQVNNAIRFKVDMTAFPNIMRINEKLLTLDSFSATAPEMMEEAKHKKS